jgi:methylamine---glutamate N-methyltransferase subunit C
LISCGKIRTPGEALKTVALGADAAYMGAILLFAMTHKQVLKALPFEPPTQVVWYDGKHADKFNPKEGGKSLGNFLKSAKLEIGEGIKALGKTSLSQVGRDDICAIDEMVAKGCKLPMAYEAYRYENKENTYRVGSKEFKENPCRKN